MFTQKMLPLTSLERPNPSIGNVPLLDNYVFRAGSRVPAGEFYWAPYRKKVKRPSGQLDKDCWFTPDITPPALNYCKTAICVVVCNDQKCVDEMTSMKKFDSNPRNIEKQKETNPYYLSRIFIPDTTVAAVTLNDQTGKCELPAGTLDKDCNFTPLVETEAPTTDPTTAPTSAPTATPTDAPTQTPTGAPTANPTIAPTTAPTATPTDTPTQTPTGGATSKPSAPITTDETPLDDKTLIETPAVPINSGAKGDPHFVGWT